MMSKSKQFSFNIRLVVIISGVMIVSAVTFMTMILTYELNCDNPGTSFTISNGVTLTQVAEQLVETHCLKSTAIFKIAMRVTFKDRKIQAGKYTLKGINNMNQLIKMITTHSAEKVKITLIEGWTLKQISRELADKLDIDIHKFLNLCYDHNFINSFNINSPSLEGFLFPDTYIFLSTYSEEIILEILINQYQNIYKKIRKQSGKTTSLNQNEITTLASIIQGEAMYHDEMSTISSVYHNRLKKRMMLQADPTIQYILPNRKKRLYSKDLKIDSPYNTYQNYGLPPGPINSPSRAALVAAANPENTNYFYFVANKNGRHIFTRTLKEHNEARRGLK